MIVENPARSARVVDSADLAPRRQRILAVASGGGHWVQLMRLRPAFDGHDVNYVTTIRGYEADVTPARVRVVNDANRWNKVGLLRLLLQVVWIVLRVRPQVVITTGAAPGYFAIRFAKLLGARTIWIDSIANAEELSMSGRMASHHADLCLTQWPELAEPNGPKFAGAVL